MRAGLLRIAPALFSALAFLSSPTLFAQPAASSPTGTTAAVGPITTRNVGAAISPPSLLHSVDPQFSEEARKAKFNGTVLVRLIVDAKGLPLNIQIIRGVGMGLDEKAIEAIKQYTFNPAMLNGKPVPVMLNIQVNFQIFDHPDIIHSVPAELTDQARQQNFQGTVQVAFTVDENGVPQNIHVPRPVGTGLDENAIAAVQQYRFKPTLSNGVPISVPASIALHFDK